MRGEPGIAQHHLRKARTKLICYEFLKATESQLVRVNLGLGHECLWDGVRNKGVIEEDALGGG